MLVCLITVAALVCACSGDSLVLDETSNGDRVSMAVGDELVVELPGHPSTGYDWYVDTLDETVLELGDQSFDTESTLIGAGGTTTLRLTAVGTGETDLRLIYERSFETADPIDEFAITVVVS
jgi:predicted secreted protein